MMEIEAKLLAKAYYTQRGFMHLISGIVEGENPNINPYEALDELSRFLIKITESLRDAKP